MANRTLSFLNKNYLEGFQFGFHKGRPIIHAIVDFFKFFTIDVTLCYKCLKLSFKSRVSVGYGKFLQVKN